MVGVDVRVLLLNSRMLCGSLRLFQKLRFGLWWERSTWNDDALHVEAYSTVVLLETT